MNARTSVRTEPVSAVCSRWEPSCAGMRGEKKLSQDKYMCLTAQKLVTMNGSYFQHVELVNKWVILKREAKRGSRISAVVL